MAYFYAAKLFFLVLSLFMLFNAAFPANAAPSSDVCAELCAKQLYEETFACYEKKYSGLIEKIKHFGDVSIVSATCAYKNGDFEIAKTFAEMKFMDHPLIWAVLKFAPKKGGAAHRMFVAEVASEKLGDKSKADKYKNLGLSYAKNSGQCEGAKDIQKCAEGYRDDIQRIMGESVGPGGGKLAGPEKILDSFQAICGKNQKFDLDTVGCACVDGFKLEAKNSKQCVLNIPLDFDMESAIDLQIAVDAMPPSSYLKTELKHKKDGDKIIGVLRQKSGRVLFTEDGEEYFSDFNRQYRPSALNKIGDAWGTVSNAPGDVFDWFTHTKWRDDEQGQYKELQWQIAKEVQEDYKEQLKDDRVIFENFRKKVEQYTGYAEWFVWLKELRGQVEDENISFGDFADDQISGLFDSFKDYGMTFPGAAIEKFVDEASIEVFSKPVIFYIGERRRGLSPQQIKESNPHELEVFVNESVRLTYGDNLLDKLEEAYQRYLLAREFERNK